MASSEPPRSIAEFLLDPRPRHKDRALELNVTYSDSSTRRLEVVEILSDGFVEERERGYYSIIWSNHITYATLPAPIDP